MRVDADEFEDFGHWTYKYLQAHIDAACLEFQVLEDVQLRAQLELYIEASIELAFELDYYPPDVFIPAFSISTQVMGGPDMKFQHPFWKRPLPQNDDGTDRVKRPWNVKPPKDRAGSSRSGLDFENIEFPPLPLQLALKVSGAMNITLPGLDFKLGKGQSFVLDLLDSDKLNNTLQPEMEYLPAQAQIEKPQINFCLKLGPRVTFKLLPLPKKASNFEKTLGNPLDIGARVDYLRIDNTLKEAHDVTEACKPGGQLKAALEYDLFYRLGFEAYFKVFSLKVDTEWVGRIDRGADAIPGFYWTVPLFKHCFDVGEKTPSDHINKLLADMFNKMQEPIQGALNKLSAGIAGFHNTPKPIDLAWNSHEGALSDFIKGNLDNVQKDWWHGTEGDVKESGLSLPEFYAQNPQADAQRPDTQSTALGPIPLPYITPAPKQRSHPAPTQSQSLEPEHQSTSATSSQLYESSDPYDPIPDPLLDTIMVDPYILDEQIM